MRPLIILGTGGSAYDVLDIVSAINALTPTWELRGFLDDARPAGSSFLNLPILGGLRDAGRFADSAFINVIGSDASYARRPHILESTSLRREQFATLIHPNASVSSWAKLGADVYVAYGVSIGGAVTVGDHVSFSPCAVVGHDSQIGDYSMIAPRAVLSGFVGIGRACYIGAGAMIRQRVQIGDGALVGLGAVVTRDVSPGLVVVGNPSRELKR